MISRKEAVNFNHHFLRRYYPDQVSGLRFKSNNPQIINFQPLSAAKAAPQDFFIVKIWRDNVKEPILKTNKFIYNRAS